LLGFFRVLAVEFRFGTGPEVVIPASGMTRSFPEAIGPEADRIFRGFSRRNALGCGCGLVCRYSSGCGIGRFHSAGIMNPRLQPANEEPSAAFLSKRLTAAKKFIFWKLSLA
jgi:hypothetical protein